MPNDSGKALYGVFRISRGGNRAEKRRVARPLTPLPGWAVDLAGCHR
jgi:hypothetical protein